MGRVYASKIGSHNTLCFMITKTQRNQVSSEKVLEENPSDGYKKSEKLSKLRRSRVFEMPDAETYSAKQRVNNTKTKISRFF